MGESRTPAGRIRAWPTQCSTPLTSASRPRRARPMRSAERASPSFFERHTRRPAIRSGTTSTTYEGVMIANRLGEKRSSLLALPRLRATAAALVVLTRQGSRRWEPEPAAKHSEAVEWRAAGLPSATARKMEEMAVVCPSSRPSPLPLSPREQQCGRKVCVWAAVTFSVGF